MMEKKQRIPVSPRVYDQYAGLMEKHGLRACVWDHCGEAYRDVWLELQSRIDDQVADAARDAEDRVG